MLVRQRKLGLRLPDDCPHGWQELRARIDPIFRDSTELHNWALRRLMVLDDVRPERDKKKPAGKLHLPSFDNAISGRLYHEAREQWPTMHTRSLSLMLRAIITKWLRRRWDFLVMRRSDMRGFRYPQPYVLADSAKLVRSPDEKRPAYYVGFSLNGGVSPRLQYGTCSRHEYSLRLKTNWKDADILDRVISGEYHQCPPALHVDRHGMLTMSIVFRFEPVERTVDPARVSTIVCGEPPRMIECAWPGCDDPMVFPGTDIMARNAAVERRRNLIRMDMKREMRLPGRKRKRREAAIRRACDARDRYVKHRNHEIARAIVRTAVRTKCGTIEIQYKSASDYAWFDLESKLQSKAAEYGIAACKGGGAEQPAPASLSLCT